jgi:hypothetical protein
MVNYLYQQQCSHLWVGDGNGESEGVLLRKARNHYLACPPQLANSPLAIACAELNVQVRRTLRQYFHVVFLTSSTGCHDCQFEGHQDFLGLVA